MRALVTGGYFDDGGDGVVWSVDLASERAEVLLRWTPPASLRVPGKGFAGGTLCAGDGLLYVAAHAAVVRIDPFAARVTGVLHQPCMNDLHHVAALGDRLYVSNTGSDAVDVLHKRGSFVGSYALVPAWANAARLGGPARLTPQPSAPGWGGAPPAPWEETPTDDPYFGDARAMPFHRRKVPDLRHVNHVARVGDRLLATCFADGTLRDLGAMEVAAALGDHRLHDGLRDGDALWLSAIDGTLFELDARTLALRRTLQVFATGHRGWCRGLGAAAGHLLVGLTEVRGERRVRWSAHAAAGSETSVLLLDRADGRRLARVDLTDRARHAKIYSVLPLAGVGG